ncbi:MAG: beta-ketoacyl synthase N-terminal-like domain-containing protein [Acidimicrobiales bacterium]
MNEDRDIAIVGMSALLPEARDVDEYWRNVVNGVDAITDVGTDRWPAVAPTGAIRIGGLELPRRGGFVPTPVAFDALKHKVVPSAAKSPTFDQFVVIDLVADALADAGIGEDDPVRESTDLIVGRGGYPTAGIAQSMGQAEGIEWFTRYLSANIEGISAADIEGIASDIRERFGAPTGEAIETTVPNFAASRAANRLDLMGAAYVVDAACASSLIAVEHAVDRLRSGRADVGIAAGVNFFQYPAFWWMLGMVGATSPTGNSRPFDVSADGIVLSEGAGVVVLKRMADAIRDDNEVYAVVKGVGSSSDGRAKGLLAPSPAGQRLSLERAYRDGSVDPASVGMIETHGTGTRIGDAAELATIREVFGPRPNRHATRPLGSVKSMIGHTIPASGIASMIKMALALRDKVHPPSLNVEAPIEGFDDVDFFVNTELRPWVRDPDHGPRRGAVNAFGFGGVNSHLILEEAGGLANRARRTTGFRSRSPISVVARPSELVIATAPSRAKLAEPLRSVLELVEAEADADLEFAALHLARLAEPSLPWRLAGVVAAADCDVAGLLRELIRRVDASGDVADLGLSIVESADAGGSMVALFGGAAPGMIDDAPSQQLDKYLHFTSAQDALDLVEGGTGHFEDPYGVSFQLRPPRWVPTADRRQMALRFQPVPTSGGENPPPSKWPLLGPVMPAVQYASWLIARDLAFDVERIVAISNGEATALAAADVVDFEPLIRTIRDLYSNDFYTGYDWSSISGGFVYATEDRLSEYLDRHAEVEITVHVDEEMQFIGGPTEVMAQLTEELRADDIVIAEMQLGGIHSRHVRPVTDQLVTEAEAGFEPREPSIPILVATGAGLMDSDGRAVLREISESMSRPLRLWQAIQDMVDEGVRSVVELGPTTQHIQFNKRLDAAEPSVVVCTEKTGVHPVTQLQSVVAELLIAGKRVDPAGLFVGRVPRGFAFRPRRSDRSVELSTTWDPLGDPSSDAGRWKAMRPPMARTARRPFVGETTVAADGSLTNRLRFDLDVDTHIVDHTFVTDDGRPAEKRFPVVALTVLVEAMAETALEATGAPAVREVRDVRVTRWVSLADLRALDVELVARPVVDIDLPEGVDAATEVTLCVDDVVHGTARFLVGPPVPPTSRRTVTPDHLVNVRVPMGPSQIYGERHFFHGPAFQCLHSVDVASEAGVTGTFVTRDPLELFSWAEQPQLALDPVILDGVGQLLAAWFFGTELKMLPTMIDRIEVFGSTPAPGTVLDAAVAPVDVDTDARFSVFDAEVGDGSGLVWMRVSGFRDWLFAEDAALTGIRLAPATHMTSSPLPIAGLPPEVTVTVMPRFQLNELQLTVVPIIILHADEFREYEGFTQRRRKLDYLHGRIALKDAVRAALGRPVHPHTVRGRLLDGRGLQVQIPGHDARVHASVTHGPTGAAAAVAGRPVGVDLETFDALSSVESESFCTPAELAFGSGLVDTAAWKCALWVAKEATAKLTGAGLRGRPFRWEIIGYDHARATVGVRDGETGRVATVFLAWMAGSVLGVALDQIGGAS